MYLSEKEKDIKFLLYECMFRQQICVKSCKLKVWPVWWLSGQFVGLSQSSPAQTNPTLLEGSTQLPRWSAGSSRPCINQTIEQVSHQCYPFILDPVLMVRKHKFASCKFTCTIVTTLCNENFQEMNRLRDRIEDSELSYFLSLLPIQNYYLCKSECCCVEA